VVRKGMVYLVGAGPGDPGLITVKGLECIRQADVIVHDRLASPKLLEEARAEAELVFVGKSAHRHAMAQEEINRILVKLGGQGKVVTRLKGGDPFLFGRGGEEAEALAAAGIPFAIVPGVTSAIAVPAYAGIPVTHRGFTSSLAIFTGHEDPTKGESRIAWEHIATSAGTLVFLMGMENLPSIVSQLLSHGCPATTPVALIRWGTLPEQETLLGTLGDIVDRAQAAGLKPPAVIIVGEVVALRERLRWFDNRPLCGKRVLVTRTREQASQLSRLLQEHGAQPVEFPVIRIEPPQDSTELDRAVRELACYQWVVFTSVHGVRSLLSRLQALGGDARGFGQAKIAAIGPATAGELKQFGLTPDYQPPEYVAEAVLEGLGEVAAQRILLPRADIAREALAEGLRQKGALVDEVAAYRTVPAQDRAEPLREMLAKGEIDIVTFTSSSTVRNLDLLGEEALSLLKGVKIACIGPITSQTARELGLAVDVEAREYTIPGLVEAIVDQAGWESSK
jgi:uroporphyrinogen III methyltransferase/synthase